MSAEILVVPEILVVDDSSFNRLLLKRRLAELGYPEPAMAANGVEALAAIAAKSFDVVLLDLEMPELDGIGVLERLHTQSNAPPVIVISAQTEMSGVIRCIELGAEDYLPKSFDPPLLRARLQAVLEKKRLRDLAAERLHALEAELESARRAQLSLVPRDFAALSRGSLTVAAHMEPAREVGGDLYDMQWIGAHHLMFVVADVAGKGASAGLTMARSMGLIRAGVRLAAARGEVPDPADLLTLANGDLAADNPDMTFVTAALAILEAGTGAGRICVAGHEAPLRLSAAGVQVMGGYRIQPPLGIIEDLPYTSAAFTLAPGEAMLLLSDGVTEAHDMEGGLFGKERVLAALGHEAEPAAAIAALLKDVADFVREAPPADDVTVLAVRYAG
ncbi:SpoIIE family protein phosphatase [Sediminicoccus sp. KRV36]|uniref:PP2C family protein-serine/threonine phosphatase n=1 Tax=Sediminicoccus sp. KRV36 TaxID=3133721 RepID=UPI00200FE604|nr:SpoIIE family protein phosphatase [Sediminicoccus rosea]UPY38241.1 SpoIIE family protein phosphatase [Sediminicoccus rosea]